MFGLQLRLALAVYCLALILSSRSAAQESNEPQGTPFHIEVNVNRVVVPVVVRDRQGHAVGDLKREDFQVFDEGKPRSISGFTVERRGATAGNSEANTQSPARPPNVTPDGVILPDRITVFLFDDMHLSAEDLARVRVAGMKVISGALTGTDMAGVVSISQRVNTGLTRDPAKLREALMKLQPQGLYQTAAAECPNIDYYEADLIESKHDPVAIQDANRKYANCNPAVSRPQEVASAPNLPTAERLVDSAANRALSLGHQDVQATYASIGEFVKRLAPLPGQRTLILVSSGFLNIERDSLNTESRIIDFAVQSNVTISSLDARGLYTTEITASEHSPALSGPSFQVNSDYHRSAMRLAENPLAELANGTGGTYFHNSNDLNAGLKELTEAPMYIYLLELSLDGVKQNGTYHTLKVKVAREGSQVETRRGYFMSKPQKQKE